MEKKISIGRINQVEIFAVSSEYGDILVPIKPICTAIGVDDKAQRTKIQDDVILCSVGVLSTSTGADEKQYEMFCLPLKYVYGWLFTINTDNVAPNVRDTVITYQERVFLAIHWFNRGRQQKAQELLEKGRDLLERERNLLDAQLSHEKATAAIKKELNEVRKEQKAVQEELMDPKPGRLPGM